MVTMETVQIDHVTLYAALHYLVSRSMFGENLKKISLNWIWKVNQLGQVNLLLQTDFHMSLNCSCMGSRL